MGRIFQDEIVGGDGIRRYNIVDSNGSTLQSNVEIRKAYTPQQVGTAFGASDITDIQNQLNTGWIPSTVTLTLSSSDSPIFVVGTSINLTSLIGVTDRIKLTQNGATIYAIVNAITSTTMTLLVESGKAIANTTTYPISNVYFSHVRNPLGFPTSPDKWSIIVSDNTFLSQSSPTQFTAYNIGSLKITVPIGMWILKGKVCFYAVKTANNVTVEAEIALSTSATAFLDFTMAEVIAGFGTLIGSTVIINPMGKPTTVTSKTDYYLVERAMDGSNNNSLELRGTYSPTELKAVSAYL